MTRQTTTNETINRAPQISGNVRERGLAYNAPDIASVVLLIVFATRRYIRRCYNKNISEVICDTDIP